ncbi:MAG: response regulator [Chloroflexi bacterium]|nr:response regulator [Chloroflexota bacterium]MBP8056526.1 response regulator [Chloroflexota bacterium]
MANIFVIDDDAQLLQMVGLMLKRGGHTATLINNPFEGLEKLKEAKPDLLILDVMMPGISGHDLTRQIRDTEELAYLPVLILTARAQEVDRVTALKSGADDYMSKPVTSHELMERIDGLLSSKQAVAKPGREGIILSFFSMRGGVGRTTLAVNLATALRRLTREEVCVVDFSPSGGQAAMHLRVQPKVSWDELAAAERLDPTLLKDSLLLHQSGLRLLAAPMLPQLPTRPSSDFVNQVLKMLRERVAFTVIDLPPIISPAVRASLSASDIVFHVVAPEVVSVQVEVQANRALIKFGLNLQQKIHVLNQTTPEAQLPASAVEKGLGTRLPFQFGFDEHQSRALAQGVPLAITTTQSPIPTVSLNMAEAIWQKIVKG